MSYKQSIQFHSYQLFSISPPSTISFKFLHLLVVSHFPCPPLAHSNMIFSIYTDCFECSIICHFSNVKTDYMLKTSLEYRSSSMDLYPKSIMCNMKTLNRDTIKNLIKAECLFCFIICFGQYSCMLIFQIVQEKMVVNGFF